MNTSGDGYITCQKGHRHWGLYGAAGLLISHRDEQGVTRWLLQKRSPLVLDGGTWSTPGGALHYGEHPVDGALREAGEEFGREHLASLEHAGTIPDDHGGWVYYTVLMKSSMMFTPDGGDDHAAWESDGTGWFTLEEMRDLPLHFGFAASMSRTCQPCLHPGWQLV